MMYEDGGGGGWVWMAFMPLAWIALPSVWAC